MTMQRKTVLMLAVSVLAGALAIYLSLQYLQQDRPSVVTREVETTSVVVAAQAVPLGHQLTRADLKQVQWPSHLLPAGTVQQLDQALGRASRRELETGEPLLQVRLAQVGGPGGLPLIIPAGKRAVSVGVDEVIGVAGFVLPHTRVDVLATMDQSLGVAQPETRVILQNVEVVASDQQLQPDQNGEPQMSTVVTLLVDPRQGEQLALAASRGQIQLALRGWTDHEEVLTSGVQGRTLAVEPRLWRRPATPPTPLQVEIWRGNEKMQTTLKQETP